MSWAEFGCILSLSLQSARVWALQSFLFYDDNTEAKRDEVTYSRPHSYWEFTPTLLDPKASVSSATLAVLPSCDHTTQAQSPSDSPDPSEEGSLGPGLGLVGSLAGMYLLCLTPRVDHLSSILSAM